MRLTLSEIITQAIDYYMFHIHTCIPGKVHSYEAATQKAQVQPLIKQVFYNGKKVSMPIVVNVPVIFPHTKTSGIKFPLAKDDTVLLCFSESSMERWLADGGETEPGVNRRFDLTDAIAIPGLFAFNAAQFGENDEQDALIIKHKDSKIVIKNDNTISAENKKSKIELSPEGKATINCSTMEFKNSEESLLSILSDALQAISEITVGTNPLDNPTIFTNLKTRLEKLI